MPNKVDQLLSSVQKPLTYIACEDNACFKEKADLNFCLIYPDLYELGIGSLGINILYSILNKKQKIWAQRAYMPDLDVQQYLKDSQLPLFSLEEQRPLKDFDILGFSLPHELCYTNLLKMLELSQIPIRNNKRSENDPLVIAGGNGAYNPLPLSPFIDVFVIGEGEEVIVEIANLVKESCWTVSRETVQRETVLQSLSKIEGVWVPSLDRQLSTPLGKEGQAVNGQRVQRRLIKDINKVSFEPLVPTSKGEKRFVLELMRGCTSGCRFCQAGFVYRPLREKEAKKALNEALEQTKNCGLNQVSLLSLSTSDYSQIEALTAALSKSLSKSNISMSLSSLRLDDFSVGILKQVGAVKKTSLTFAIEAGSQRLRDMINKRLSEEQILSTLKGVFESGWTKLKLYFMVGLPTETKQDLQELVHLVDKIVTLGKETLPKNQRKRLNITVSVSNYVPKAHTPFQWSAQSNIEEIEQKHSFLMSNIKGPQLNLKWHNAKQSIIEGLIARGDEKIAKIIETAYNNGAQFDNFSERFNFAIWQKAIELNQITIKDYQRERKLNESLPWDFIDIGIEKEFFKGEYNKALEGVATADCRIDKCPQCGLCTKEIKNVFSKQISNENATLNNLPADIPDKLRQSQKYRLYIKREGYYRYLSHLEWINLLERRLRVTDVSLATRGLYNPRPKFSYSEALPVGSEILTQYVDFELKEKEPLNVLEKKLKAVFNRSLLFEELKLLSGKAD